MMLCGESFSVDLRVCHPSLPLAEICDLMGRRPDVGWSVEDPRRTPRGRVLGGVRESSYWCLSLQVATTEFLSQVLRRTVLDLGRIHFGIKELVSSKGRVEVYVGVDGDRSAGDTIPSEVLVALGTLGVDLSFEVFPVRQRRGLSPRAER